MPMNLAYIIHVPIRKQPIRLTYSHVTNIYIYIYIIYIYIYIYIYIGRPLERLGFSINSL